MWTTLSSLAEPRMVYSCTTWHCSRGTFTAPPDRYENICERPYLHISPFSTFLVTIGLSFVRPSTLAIPATNTVTATVAGTVTDTIIGTVTGAAYDHTLAPPLIAPEPGISPKGS